MGRGLAQHRQAMQSSKARAIKRIKSRYEGMVDLGRGGIERKIGIDATTPHRCSGPCCGNERHFSKGDERLTIQERRAATIQDDF